jgi:hypothetical protein
MTFFVDRLDPQSLAVLPERVGRHLDIERARRPARVRLARDGRKVTGKGLGAGGRRARHPFIAAKRQTEQTASRRHGISNELVARRFARRLRGNFLEYRAHGSIPSSVCK